VRYFIAQPSFFIIRVERVLFVLDRRQVLAAACQDIVQAAMALRDDPHAGRGRNPRPQLADQSGLDVGRQASQKSW
jgi:hypothetical protein